MIPGHLKAAIHSKTPLHEGFLRVYRYEFDTEKHGGGIRRTSWEMMERGDAVAVLAHDPVRDEVVLGNEFRPGVLVAGEYPYRDNLIAGGIKNHEVRGLGRIGSGGPPRAVVRLQFATDTEPAAPKLLAEQSWARARPQAHLRALARE